MKLYLINFNETYRADEQGVRAMMNVPSDTEYYKHEIISEADVELPEGYRLEEFEWGNAVMYGVENAEIVTYQVDGGYKTVLVTSRREELLMYWGTYKYLVEVDGEFHDAVVGIDGIGSFIHRGQEMRVSRRNILESPTPKGTGRGFLLIYIGKRVINDIHTIAKFK
jgi:hypothetical protein